MQSISQIFYRIVVVDVRFDDFFQINSIFVAFNIIIFNPKLLAYPRMNSVTASFLGTCTVRNYSVVLNETAESSLNINAEIIILTRGRRIDVINPQDPYPDANNPNSTGYYDYDKIRRVEVRILLLFDKDEEGVKDFCCYSEE